MADCVDGNACMPVLQGLQKASLRLECFFGKGLMEKSQIFTAVYIYFSITVSGQSGIGFELVLLKLQI